MAVVNWTRPPHNVPSQLKVFTADGTAMVIDRTEKPMEEYGLMPLVNMWCPHTSSPRKPMAKVATIMACRPKIGLRANVDSNSEISPMPGRIAM